MSVAETPGSFRDDAEVSACVRPGVKDDWRGEVHGQVSFAVGGDRSRVFEFRIVCDFDAETRGNHTGTGKFGQSVGEEDEAVELVGFSEVDHPFGLLMIGWHVETVSAGEGPESALPVAQRGSTVDEEGRFPHARYVDGLAGGDFGAE